MEPSYNAPRITPEQTPALPPVSPEVVPAASPERRAEHESQSMERESLPQQPAATMPDPTVTATPAPSMVDDGSQATDDGTALLGTLPDLAADDDVIEKEWVSKAKHIITETADDPYRREKAIGQLQREYIRRRYGGGVDAS